ncbi:MAG: Fic family protein [Firmicutes bacterium]|nr:Fic family protein [Bacillota bacterium]
MSRIGDVLRQYEELGIWQQLDYDKFYLYSIITHSTAIEGSTVSEVENQLLFDEGISSDKPIHEQLMNLDLKKAYEEAFAIADRHETITVELLCFLSSIVMKNTGSLYNTIAGTFNSAEGELRLLNVSAGRGGKSYMAWQKVPDRLGDFCEWLNEARKGIDEKDPESVYRMSFEAHYRMVTIHPWADGNGRMARLVMNMIQREAGMIPSIVKKEKRAEYIQSLSDSQTEGNESIFIDFMLKHHIENIEEQIVEYQESVKNDTIKAANDTLNDTLNLPPKEQEVFGIIKANPDVTINGIIAESGFSRPTVTRAISTLKEKSFIKRIGSRKSGSWKVIR